ncbi:unnamed protein product [Cylindrotheca closterium]|uniref:Uncharacterized protein n=1 Tax=Cylindrotheca closterium TaxID=2856 RepID=A0AAD2CND1_9STRA|nr:unnamed protein product [Cylindrotheca closterium]
MRNRKGSSSVGRMREWALHCWLKLTFNGQQCPEDTSGLIGSSPSLTRDIYYEHQEFPTPSAHQWSGCSATLLNKVARRAKSGGKDETGLGRFSWIKIRGRDIQQQRKGVRFSLG